MSLFKTKGLYMLPNVETKLIGCKHVIPKYRILRICRNTTKQNNLGKSKMVIMADKKYNTKMFY